MVSFRALCRSFSRLAKAAAEGHLRQYDKWRSIRVFLPDEKSQAVSDGELNMSTRGSGGSSSSLPGTPAGETGPANRVLSWAVSFEKLLEDPCGVNYFTTFLRSEVSAENILFWQACEKFKKIPATLTDELRAAAQSIYDTYLSENASYAVNIDDTAKTEEKDLQQPTSDMFNKAQDQIFKLMKMDSYRRFVRSPLYQKCTLASVEGKLLPQLSNEPVYKGSWEEVVQTGPTIRKSDSNSLTGVKTLSEKHRPKRGSWGADTLTPFITLSRKDSDMSVKSAGSMEFGSLHRTVESSPSSQRSPEQGGRRFGLDGGYCCVYLPDGSASLAPTPNGLTIKEMLSGLCEKRGFPLKDVIIYLHGKEKQPLSLDQDCCVLRDQQVILELRVTFALEIAFTGKTGGIMVKSSKTLQDALSTVLQKHHLKPQDAIVTMVGNDELVNMNSTVFRLANKKLRLDRAKAGKEQNNIASANGSASVTQAGAGSTGAEAQASSQTNRLRTQPKPSKNPDMDGLLEMLTKAQCSRVDDQRGLLTKEQLEVPEFLQLPPKQDSVNDRPATSSGEQTSDSPKLETKEKELKETSSASSTSPQKQMKSRSKSTEEMQHSRKAFSSQKSLPGRPELDKVKECFEGSDTPLSSTEELK
ncbi:regulator of G-protein signaling 14-like [Neosynchiropus ocellatus]